MHSTSGQALKLFLKDNCQFRNNYQESPSFKKSIELLELINLPRKEVIHPHVPVRIPCYDLTPIISPTLGLREGNTSGIGDFHGLTGGDCVRVISDAPHWTCASNASSESLRFKARICSIPSGSK